MAFSSFVRFLSTLRTASGHQRCSLAGVPPQPNSPSGDCPGNLLSVMMHVSTLPEQAFQPSFSARSNGLWQRENSPHIIPGVVLRREATGQSSTGSNSVSKATLLVVVFHCWYGSISHLCYTHHVTALHQTGVKLNRVFFPR